MGTLDVGPRTQIGMTCQQDTFSGSDADSKATAKLNLARIGLPNQHFFDFGGGSSINTASGTFNFTTLLNKLADQDDLRLTGDRGPNGLGKMCVTFCRCPVWMREDTADSNSFPTAANFANYAALCYRTIAEVLPLGVHYFQFWNEFKGMFSSTLSSAGVVGAGSERRYRYENYTTAYNVLWDMIQADDPGGAQGLSAGLIRAAGFRPGDVKLGGPYPAVASYYTTAGYPSNHTEKNTRLTGATYGPASGHWGVIDMIGLDSVDYFISNAHGYDFLCFDARLKNNDLYESIGGVPGAVGGLVRTTAGVAGITTWGQGDANGTAFVTTSVPTITTRNCARQIGDIVRWIAGCYDGGRFYTTSAVPATKRKPIWCSEFHVGNGVGIGWTISEAGMATLMQTALEEANQAGLDVALHWTTEEQGVEEVDDPSLVRSTAIAEAAPPTPYVVGAGGGQLTPVGKVCMDWMDARPQAENTLRWGS